MSSIDEIARKKIQAPFGDRLWHPGEKIERVEPIEVPAFGGLESMFVIYTTSTNSIGARKNGRILLSFTETVSDPVAGVFYITEANKKKIQSVYADADFRKGVATRILAQAAKSIGIKAITGPFSPAGEAFAARYSFKIVEGQNVYSPVNAAELRQAIGKHAPLYSPNGSGFSIEHIDRDHATIIWQNAFGDEIDHRDEAKRLSGVLPSEGYEVRLTKPGNMTLLVRKVVPLIAHGSALGHMGPFEQAVERLS